MHWIDWCITIIPVMAVLGVAIYSRRYMRGVADFLAAGRVAGRYVITIGDMESALGIATIIAVAEAQYQTGYAVVFWSYMIAPLSIVIALTGYCVYRFRETKALSLGQFLEMRYNRVIRIVGSGLRSSADMLGNAVAPTIAANFFIYFLGLPHHVTILGVTFPSFSLIVGMVLFMAVLIIWLGGRVSLLITDFMQGIMTLPIFVVFTIYFMSVYSWGHEIAPILTDRAPNESFLNPFDISKLRDFNLFLLVVAVVNSILNRASWVGNDTSNCARTPHEQKMAGILGAWRGGITALIGILFGLGAITIMQHPNFAPKAKEIRIALSDRAASQVMASPKAYRQLMEKVKAVPEQQHQIGIDPPLAREKNLDTPYLNIAHEVTGADGEGNYLFQKFKTLYHQMLMPMAMQRTLPIGLMGLFCLLMVMLMLSTDDSRIMNCSSTIIQDVVMPFRKKPLTPKEHVFWLRMGALIVAMVFFGFSLFFVQLDYVNMMLTAMFSIWLGGAGPVMIFGLYSRFGNTVGAFCSLIFGSGISISGVILQASWAKHVYPFLERMGWVGSFDGFLRTVTAPFSPYVTWHMDPMKFPINSYEIFFLAMMSGLIAYVAGSLLTYRRPYNLERMLHRGKYNLDHDKKENSPWTWKNFYKKLIGITPEYTRGDRFIAWLVFGYSFVYQIGFCFLFILLWNAISPWPNEWWSHYFFFNRIAVPAVIAAVTTVWFTIGGIRDARRLFRDLSSRVDNPLDDGRVEGHVSLMDKAALGSDTNNDKK